jgi:RNA polymerase subunit RPABC4/transcription elongation factor Spt4
MICPHCKTEIPDDASICKACGNNVTKGHAIMVLVVSAIAIGVIIYIMVKLEPLIHILAK